MKRLTDGEQGVSSFYERLTPMYALLRAHHAALDSPSELREWAERVHEWRADGPVFVRFNSAWNAFAPRNAMSLLRLLERLAS